jgi:hypothetical protein
MHHLEERKNSLTFGEVSAKFLNLRVVGGTVFKIFQKAVSFGV